MRTKGQGIALFAVSTSQNSKLFWRRLNHAGAFWCSACTSFIEYHTVPTTALTYHTLTKTLSIAKNVSYLRLTYLVKRLKTKGYMQINHRKMSFCVSLATKEDGKLCSNFDCEKTYCIVLYCTLLYCTVPYRTVLYCTVLYCGLLRI